MNDTTETILNKLSQLQKAFLPINLIEEGITISFKEEQPSYLQLVVYQKILIKTVEK